MAQSKRLRRNLSLVAITTALAVGAWAAGCGGSDDTSSFGNGNDGGGDGQTFGDGNTIGFGDGSSGNDDGSASSIVISPPNPTVDVTIVNGVVTVSAVNFVAKTLAGNPVAASWSLDRGELGTLVTGSGLFTAGGTVAGTGTVSAQYGASIAKTNVTVTIHSTQDGNDYGDGGVPEAGVGGVGGVGGEGLGGAVNSAGQASLTTGATAPSGKAQLGWLYPYDKTVFPRGQLAPLLQWESNLAGISAVYIHLSETGYDFKGYYSVSGASQFHQPIDQAAWAAATSSNTGDNLQVQITLLGSAGAVGPITENWIVAPGILTGTIYYQTYASVVAGTAGTLAIRPGKTDPTLAIPGTKNQCVVCHEVSGDGSTIVIENSSYASASSYDLTDGGAVIQSYNGAVNAADGTSNNEKFLWSALSKDGTYGLSSLKHTREAYQGPENIYRRDNASSIATTGFQTVTEAVTPEFSRDEKSIAFNGWTLQADAGIPSGNGHTLDVMDFACGAGDAGVQPSGGAPPSCGAFSFANLRRLYTNSDNTNGWVGWPAWTPDSQGIAFHNSVRAATDGNPTNGQCSNLATWHSAEAQLWYTNVPPASGTFADGGAAPAAAPVRMNALNGLNAGGTASYLPLPADVTGSDGSHSDDTMYNYEPTINPIASGGYYWVVFTSRRMYGNIAKNGAYSVDTTQPIPKKLWVAAIDINPTPGTDPSHPAFYLPGQEIDAPNMRGFWVVDPCRSNGSSCETGDECCNGFCRAPGDGGGLVCGDKPPGCAQELEKCATTADCCGTGSLVCINGTCSKPSPR